MAFFDWLFARNSTPARAITPEVVPASMPSTRMPRPSCPLHWKRASRAEWLAPDTVHHKDSRIAQHPEYYDWCGRLADVLFTKHPELVTQPVTPPRSIANQWTNAFSSAVVRWLLLLPRGAPDQQHYCNCLAVCINLPGFDTTEEIDDFVAWSQAPESHSTDDADPPFLTISNAPRNDLDYRTRVNDLWIRATPVFRATRDRTFLRVAAGSLSGHLNAPPTFTLRAINPTSLPPTQNGQWNSGYFSWLSTPPFLSFLSKWATSTPLVASGVPFEEPSATTDYDSWTTSGFTEICNACGSTYFDTGDTPCANCGCRANDKEAFVQYTSSDRHANWVLGELRDEVARELHHAEESRRRDEEARRRHKEEKLHQQRILADERRKAEERSQEKIRIDREKQSALAAMASAAESITALRRKLNEMRGGDKLGNSTREACLRKLRDAISQYEAARKTYKRLREDGVR